MQSGEFWLQSNNGKRYSLSELKNIKKEDIAQNPKLQRVIKLFDYNGNGSIEIDELKSVFSELQQAAVDNYLSAEEFGLYISQKLPNEDVKLEDINELLDIASRGSDAVVNQVGNKTITVVNGKITKVVTDLGNNQTKTTFYEYVEETENSPAHVVLTSDDNNSVEVIKVISVDENGEFNDNQFIYKKISTVENGEPILVTIGKNENGQILEQKERNDKIILNIYKESSFKNFESKTLEKLYQEVRYGDETYYAFYDGLGNTYIPIKNGEGINNFISRVNKELRKIGKKELTISDLKKLNPNVDLTNLKVANPHTGDTGMLLISGRYNADSSIVYKSGTVGVHAQAQANDAMNKAIERVNNKNFENYTLAKNYASYEALAKDLSVDVHELMVLNQSEVSANGLIVLSKGAKLRVPVELTGKDTSEIIKKAFPLIAENRIFYQRYNLLNQNQKQNVLNVIRSMQGKSSKEIKDSILKYYPDINLFDSGLAVPVNNQSKMRLLPSFEGTGQSNVVSLETFITDYLKLDLKSQNGQIVYKRLAGAAQSNLNQLSASDFSDCSKMQAHQILEMLFSAGVQRTGQEAQIRQRQIASNPMWQEKQVQNFAADVLYNMIKQASDILHEYHSKIGYLSGDAMWQGLKNIANYAALGNVETIWKEMDKLDSMLAKAEELKHSPNSAEFEKLFKEFTNGFAYDKNKMQNLINVTNKVAQGKLKEDSGEYIKAFQAAFGSKVNLHIVQDTNASVQGQMTKGSICDIVMMLSALGTVGKIGKMKQFSQWAISALGKYGGSALVGATNLAGWTAVQQGTNLLTRKANVTSDDLKEYGWEIIQSGGFGAAGGVWGNFAVSRMMGWTDKGVNSLLKKWYPKAVEKQMSKAAEKVGNLFKTTSETTGAAAKNGADVIAEITAPGYTAQVVGFFTEVAGFTGYQTIVDTAVNMIQEGGISIESIRNVLIKKAEMQGELNDEVFAEIKNMSYGEAILSLLKEEFGEQLQSLGTIKGVEAAMKFIMSGRIGMTLDAANFEKFKTLKEMKIKSTSLDGKQFYEITMPDGKKMVLNNEYDLIAFCNQQMQVDILTNMVNEKLKKFEGKTEYDAIEKVVEAATPDMNRDVRFNSFNKTNITKESLEAKISELPNGEFKDYVEEWKERVSDFMADMIYPKLDNLIDAYKNASRIIENVKDESIKQQARDMLIESIRIGDMTAAAKRLSNIEEFIKIQTLSPSEKFMSYLKDRYPKIYAELQKNPDEINNPKYKEIRNDFLKLQKYENIIVECRAKSGTSEADALYEKYLNEEFVSNNAETDSRIKDMCRQINKEFGVKVFLPSNMKEAGVGLKLVYQQLARYKMHAKAHGEIANMPSTLDFYKSGINYIKSPAAAGTYTSYTNSMSLNGLTIDIIKKALAHELTHANDKKALKEFPVGFDCEEYEQEFTNAGLDFSRFKYACTNPKEFIAVASEGNISKYSEGFKKILKDFGMPEWMFEMDRVLTPEEQKEFNGNMRLLNALFKNIETFGEGEIDLMHSFYINDADKKSISRYNELVEKRDTKGLNQAEMSELLGLTMDLNDKGYRFGTNGNLDFSYNSNVDENIPNLNMTKTELRNKLASKGLSESAIEDIVYNANRIQPELLNAIDDTALLEQYRASVLISAYPKDIPSKLEIYNLLKSSSIPTRVKAKILGETGEFNIDKIKKHIESTNNLITFLKEQNADENLISKYAMLLYECSGRFSYEMFEQISKYNKELLNSDICFNVQEKDIPAKIEVFKLIQEKGLQKNEILQILHSANEENLEKIRLIESHREELSSRQINLIYRNIEMFNENSLASLEKNALLLEYYDVISLSKLTPEDLEAKSSILKSLKAFEFDKSSFVKKVTRKNYEKLSKEIEILNNIASLEKLSTLEKKQIANLVIAGNYNADVMAILMNAVKNDAGLLFENLRASGSNFTKDIFRTKTVEEAQQKAEIYNLLKDLTDPKTKLYYMNLVNENNFESVKEELIRDLPIFLKYEAAEKIKQPQFTEGEKQEIESKLEEINNILAQKKPEKIQSYLRYFERSNTIEAFNAKYSVFKRLEAENRLDYYWLLENIIIQEQADIINNAALAYNTKGICDRSFAQSYPFLKQFDSKMKAQGIASRKSGDDFVEYISQIESIEQFQRFKVLWADKNLSQLSLNELSILAKDVNKFNLYQQFFKLDGELTIIEGTEILEGIASGDIKEITTVEQMLKQTALAKSKVILAEYRAGKERYFSNAQSKDEIYNRLKVTFPNLNIKNMEHISEADMNFLELYISNYQELSLEQIENAINRGNIAGLGKRANIISKFPSDTAFYLAFCSEAEFDTIVSQLEKRPEILTKRYDKGTFVKLINMSDLEWEAFKIPIKERTNNSFDIQKYSQEVQELLNSGFTLNMDTWRGIERKRLLEAQNHLGGQKGGKFIKFDDTPFEQKSKPILTLPSADTLMQQLETTGRFTLEIGNTKDLPPIQVKNDKAVVKPNEPVGVQETDQSINIGKTRIWDNHRLARDLLQNFYDGNGHTMEGVTISVEKRGDKYAVKICGRGLFDYDRVLDFGGGSKGGTSEEYVYGRESGDPESAGLHGEGSKIIAGNLLCTRGSGYVRYASGDWIMNLGVSEENMLGERVITKEISKAPKRLEGTTYEFETNDIELVKSILNAKDYFNGPSNKDWAVPDIENEYFAIKFLPKGEKGNLYVVQRFEVEGQEGFDGTLDGMTLIFKRQPHDEGLKNSYFPQPYKLGVGRNRVGLTKDEIKNMVQRYAMTLDNESLTKIIGNMEESFLYDSNSPTSDIAEAFIWAAYFKGIKIDFGHDKYVATASDMNARYLEGDGKIPVNYTMQYLGVPKDVEYFNANQNAMMPKMNLTETQTRKLKLLSEAMRLFSSRMDIENSDVISEGNVEKPVYVTESIVKEEDNSTSEVRAESISDCNGYYGGHWVKESYLDNGDFFSLLATWLHETSHKVAGDGAIPFNERLMKLQELIVDISNTDPSFGQQLRILSNEFDKLSGQKVTDVVAKAESDNIEKRISQLLKAAVEKVSKTNHSQNVEVSAVDSQSNIAAPTNIFKKLYKKLYNKLWGTYNQKINPYIKSESPMLGVEDVLTSEEITQSQKDKDSRLIAYESPAPALHTQVTLTAATPERNMQILEQKGSVSIQIPVKGTLNPKIGNSSILPNDKKNIGITQNSSLTLDYGNAQEWTKEIVARDLFQNFYDGHNGTLDGVKLEIQKINGKYKVKIIGQSEYNYFYLKTIGASDKTEDPKKAGGFGEGAKMASKTLLGEGLVDKITFASGDWTMDFTREEGVPLENKPHLARTLYENKNRVNGTTVEFETTDRELVEAILRGKDYFQSSDNPDFKRIQEQGVNSDDIGFVVLPENETGNLYYIQRYAIKQDGQLEGALKGLSIVFKRQLTKKEKQRYGLADDPDRKGFTPLDIENISKAMVKALTKEELVLSVEKLERFWTFATVNDINAAIKGKLQLTPEQSFAKSIVHEAFLKEVIFDCENLKMVAVSENDNGYDIQRLQKMGYKPVFDYMKSLGIPSVKEVISKLDNVSDINKTVKEEQKIALLKEAFESGLDIEINLFDAEPNEKKIRGIFDEQNQIKYIAIDRKALDEMSFNTLYTQILIQYNFSKEAENWGYNMTRMIAKQLNLSKDPLFMERFNALAKTFNELK